MVLHFRHKFEIISDINFDEPKLGSHGTVSNLPLTSNFTSTDNDSMTRRQEQYKRSKQNNSKCLWIRKQIGPFCNNLLNNMNKDVEKT